MNTRPDSAVQLHKKMKVEIGGTVVEIMALHHQLGTKVFAEHFIENEIIEFVIGLPGSHFPQVGFYVCY